MNIESSTLQYTYPQIGEAIAWYTTLIGREADFVSSPEFQEWEIYPNCWLQIAKGELKTDTPRLRLGVDDVETVKDYLEQTIKVTVDNRFYTPGVVLLYNFNDPWGYQLGIFQDLQSYPLKEER